MNPRDPILDKYYNNFFPTGETQRIAGLTCYIWKPASTEYLPERKGEYCLTKTGVPLMEVYYGVKRWATKVILERQSEDLFRVPEGSLKKP